MRGTRWPQKVAVAQTATRKSQKTRMVSELVGFSSYSSTHSALFQEANPGIFRQKNPFSPCPYSEEKIWPRFDVQQPDEHREEKAISTGEPREKH